MPGKTSLYQRVLTRPGATLLAEPTAATETGRALSPLSILFVYGRNVVGEHAWVEVGAASRGQPDGWLREADTIAWKQTLTVTFTIPADREPALFFRDHGALENLIRSEQMLKEVDRLRTHIQQGDIPSEFPVISMEPPTYVDPRKHFYLLPILNFDRANLAGYRMNLLNVAAVTLRPGQEDLLGKDQTAASRQYDTRLLKDFRAGIVFVIDSTISMGPYLDRTREAVRRIYRRLKDSPWGRNVSFGLVAFRDYFETGRDREEYVTRIFATLADGRSEDAFFEKVRQLEADTVSNRDFNEDSYAGLSTAIEELDWDGYGSRIVILITDAGARGATDPLSHTRLGAERLRILAQEKKDGKIALYALHLLTREGRHTHDLAAGQYRALTRWEEAGELYFPAPTGSVAEFGGQVDALADLLVRHVEQSSQGKLVEVPAAGASELEQKTAIVGRAMQLAYLGRAGGAEAPRLINAWVADLDFAKPSHKTLEVRVLISKNQLSDLQQTLQTILEAGERTRIDAKDFFNQLRSAAARMARDPENVNERQVRRLADVGLIGEWLVDLPYNSKIMELTEDYWLSMGPAWQWEFLDEIEEKIRVYQKFHDDTDRWIMLDGGRVPGDAVSSIPVDLLP
jgi:serine/threonine-protein kinase PpkA